MIVCLKKCLVWISIIVSTAVTALYIESSITIAFTDDIDKLKRLYVKKTSSVLSTRFHPTNNEQVVLTTTDGYIYLWDFKHAQIVPFLGQTGKVFDAAISHDNSLMASAGFYDKTVRIWDIKTRQEIQKISFNNTVTKIDFSPDGRYLAIGFRAKPNPTNILFSTDADIVIWDIQSRKQFGLLKQHDVEVSSLSFSRDGQWLISAGYSESLNNSLYVTEWMTQKVIRRYIYPKTPITSAAISDNNKYLALGLQDGKVYIRDVETGEQTPLSEYNLWTPSLKFTHDNQHLFAASFSNKVTLEDISGKKTQLEIQVSKSISRADLSPNNQFISISMIDGTVFIYDLQGKLQHSLIVSKAVDQWISCNYSAGECVKNISITWNDIWENKTSGLMIMIMLLFFLAYIRLRYFKHPLVIQLSEHPEALLSFPVQQLGEIRKLLLVTQRLDMVLNVNQISPLTFRTAARFSRLKPKKQADFLARRLLAQIVSQDSEFYTVELPTLFPLNIEKCCFYFPDKQEFAKNIQEKLSSYLEVHKYKVIVITTDMEQQQGLRKYAEDIHNEVIMPSSIELTHWLLSAEPIQTVSRLMATQLNLMYLSPYHNRGTGIDKDTSFFGRTHIISQITGRELQNYIIVAGRRIGKTSLLKYLFRHYRQQQDLEVIYLDATASNFIRLLANELHLDANCSLNEIIEHLKNSTKIYLFLIDEADVFIKNDKESDYVNLNKLRTLSTEGHCYFILAGFWHLYQAAIFEYHCPLRNFGDIFELGALEVEAARDLVKKPMSSMNIDIPNDSVEYIVRKLGQRADLITQFCHLLVMQLDFKKFIVESSIIEKTFWHQNIIHALYGWQELAPSEKEQKLDRMIMNLMLTEDSFDQKSVTAKLKDRDFVYHTDMIKQSLRRLVLCCVLKVEAKQYCYAIPLLKEALLDDV